MATDTSITSRLSLTSCITLILVPPILLISKVRLHSSSHNSATFHRCSLLVLPSILIETLCPYPPGWVRHSFMSSSRSFVMDVYRYRESFVYSSCRRNQGPVSLRPFGARSSHWYIPQSASRPRAYAEYVWYTTPSESANALMPGASRV